MSLPILGTPCSSEDLDARLAELSALQHAFERGAIRKQLALGRVILSLVVVVVCLWAYEDTAFTHACGGLLAFAAPFCVKRVTAERPAVRRSAWIICVVLLILGLLVGLVPTPNELLAALDLQAHPVSALAAALLSSLCVVSVLQWDEARTSQLPGAIAAPLVAYVEQLSRPLLQDAALGARGALRLSPFEPNAGHWLASVEGSLHSRTLERLVCELMVPLERDEHVLLQVREKVVERQSRRTNRRGKLKVKSKGYVRSLQARLRWQLRGAGQEQDLTPQLEQHLSQAGLGNAGVECQARGAADGLEVRLRQQVRAAQGTYVETDSWLDVELVHACAGFLAQARAGWGQG